jgi:hypothetical protein
MADKPETTLKSAKESNQPNMQELIEGLQTQISKLEVRLETAESEKDVYEEEVAALRESLEDFQRDTGEDIEPQAEVSADPWYSKNPFKIIGEIPPDKAHPTGQVLSWLNVKHRMERRGFRGWTLLQYGDEYTGENGEKLADYILDVPPRMEGSARMDSYVRRADSALGRIDKYIFEARQRQRVLDSQRNVAQAGSPRTTKLREGVEVVGPGLKTQKRPAGGWKRGETPVVGEHHQRLPVTKKD